MSQSIPPRKNRVLQAVDFIKKEIQRGKLVDALPGEQELAKRIGVGRVTLRSALQILEEEGWVSAAEPRQRRKVLMQASEISDAAEGDEAVCAGKVVVNLSPTEIENQSSFERLNHSRLTTLLAKVGVRLIHRKLDLSDIKEPAHRLKEFVLRNPADLYMLHFSTYETQEWFARENVPCVILGTTWKGLKHPCVDYDQKAIGRHLALVLSRLGHQRVGMLHSIPVKQGVLSFFEGFNETFTGEKLILAEQDDTPESILKAISSLVRDEATRPTALILSRVSYVLAAVSALPSLGLLVPRDISLVSHIYDDAFRNVYPNVAGYRLSKDALPNAMYDLIVKKLRHPDIQIDTETFVIPELVMADSLAKVPQ